MARSVKFEVKAESKEIIYYIALIFAAFIMIISAYQVNDQDKSYQELKERHEDLIGKFRDLNQSSNALLQKYSSLVEETLDAKADNAVFEQQINKCNRLLKTADSECKLSRNEDVDSYLDQCNVQLQKRSDQCLKDINDQVDECNALLRKQLNECNDHWQEQIRLIT